MRYKRVSKMSVGDLKAERGDLLIELQSMKGLSYNKDRKALERNLETVTAELEWRKLKDLMERLKQEKVNV